jgi:hypothetical protein
MRVTSWQSLAGRPSDFFFPWPGIPFVTPRASIFPASAGVACSFCTVGGSAATNDAPLVNNAVSSPTDAIVFHDGMTTC